MITVYTQPGCPHCVLAKKYLDQLEIPYREINIRADDEALALMRAAGHTEVPQLYVGSTLLVKGGNAGLRKLSKADIEELVSVLS